MSLDFKNQLENRFQNLEFLSYYDEVWKVFYDDTELNQQLGCIVWNTYDDQLYSQLTLLKVLAVDAVGVLLRIYLDLMHKYDHIGDERMMYAIINIADRVTPYDKKESLGWFDHDLSSLEKRVKSDDVGNLLHEKGLSCQQLITRLIKFERDLNDKFSDESSEDSIDASKRTDQSFIDDYFDSNRALPEV